VVQSTNPYWEAVFTTTYSSSAPISPVFSLISSDSYLHAKTRACEIILRARNYSELPNKNYNGTNPDVGKKALVHE